MEWDWGLYIEGEEKGGTFERWGPRRVGRGAKLTMGKTERVVERRRESWKSKNQRVVWEKRDKVGPTTRRHGLK